MNGYQCQDCADVFRNPTTERIVAWDEAHGVRARSDEIIDSCPRCGSLEIEEVALCPECLKTGAVDRVYDEYGTCIKHAQTEDADG